MAGGGVGTGQDHDALTAARFELTIDGHSMSSSLQRAGVTAGGARQFANGDAVSSPSDRLALARAMSSLLKRLNVR
jgi:hypothetical protein